MNPVHWIQEKAYEDFSLVALKGAVILIALIFILVALTTRNKWVLAGILAYEVLP